MKTNLHPRLLFTFVACVSLLTYSCQQETEKKITNQNDYIAYLDVDHTASSQKLSKEVAFWNGRIKNDSSQIVDLKKSASVYTALFHNNADIHSLKKAERNLVKGVEKAAIGKDNYLRALAQNYITQHRFKEAKVVIDKASAIGGELSATNFIKFDVAMELGNYTEAEQLLKKETDFSEYNYLIRLAKWEDYKGNLDATIQHMETAMGIAERSNVASLKIWVYTNIADYYGHAGRIQDSYNHYMKALDIEPRNAYAKKGLAWIAYSYEHNPEEALRIIQAIEKDSKSPDYSLFKAEIYESMGNTEEASRLIQTFLTQSAAPAYGDMYGAYLVEIYAADSNTAGKAITLAQKEVANRPTPMSYDLLAHAYYASGQYEKALEIAKNHVIGKTHEPMAHFHTAQIYKALDMQTELAPLKEELLEANYELGPLVYKEILDL